MSLDSIAVLGGNIRLKIGLKGCFRDEKRVKYIFFAFFLTITCIFTPINASAYEVTGVEKYEKAGMLISLDTEEILYENNIDMKVYPASITKIMTTILILESDSLFGLFLAK